MTDLLGQPSIKDLAMIQPLPFCPRKKEMEKKDGRKNKAKNTSQSKKESIKQEGKTRNGLNEIEKLIVGKVARPSTKK